MLHFCRSPDEFPEYRMRPVRPGFEFRMILHAKEKGMIFQLHGFHQQSVRRYTGDDKTLLLQYIAVIVVKLIAVAVPFPDLKSPRIPETVLRRPLSAGRRSCTLCSIIRKYFIPVTEKRS